MISVACREIWMSPSSSIGDCAPIMLSPTGPVEMGEANRAKVESPIIQEFRDSATRNGYDPLLSRAMVVTGDEVWWLEQISDPNVRRFVASDEKTRLIDDVDAEQRAWRLVEQDVVTRANGEQKQVKISQPVEREDELLTMSQYDAVLFGFARGIAEDLEDLASKLEIAAAPKILDKSGWEQFAMWLNSPLVRGLLLILVLVGAYLEFQHPGMILPGATALIALAIFLAAPYAAGLANIWTIVVLAIGLVLLIVEIFVIPGFGIAGLLGIALILVAMLGTFVPSEPQAPPFSLPTLPATWDGLWMGLRVMTLSILASLVGIFLLVTYFPRTRMAEGVVTGNPDAAVLAIDTPHAHVAQLGDVGTVTGDLRPGGQARFGQEIVDVRSQGEYVAKGQRVQVIRREGIEVWVRPLSDEPRA
jgi:membrane-bound serine protease (ClpP class)